MSEYPSSSSDSDTQTTDKTLNLSNQHLDMDMLHNDLEDLISSDKEIIENTDTLLLNHNSLSKLPPNLSKFHQLKALNISSNGLKYLPECLEQCPLTSLVARNNILENDCFPKSFLLHNLRELILSGNHFSFFPPEILHLQTLKYLYLGGNNIANIPKDIWKLQRLTVLYMGGNKLVSVPSTVGQLINLQALILSDNMIKELPHTIANLTNLRILHLNKNKLKALPTAIITLRSLTELSLRDNPFVAHFVKMVATTPPTLLEITGRAVKAYSIPYSSSDIPESLVLYLNSSHSCVNPKCGGVYFDSRVEHVKFVDFCGKYRVPLLQYLCSTKCVPEETTECDDTLLRRVLLG